jgi:hypothetical protein
MHGVRIDCKGVEHSPVGEHSLEGMGGPTCHELRRLRSERVGRKLYRCWEPWACRCRSPAAPPRRLPCRSPIHRQQIPHSILMSRSTKKSSPTSTWGRSSSSTRKPPAHPGRVCNMPALAAAAEAAAAEAAAAGAAGPVAAAAAADVVDAEAAVAAAASRGAPAAGSARL